MSDTQNPEIRVIDIKVAYEKLESETDPTVKAYYWGWCHALNSLHTKGFFQERAMYIDKDFFKAMPVIPREKK